MARITIDPITRIEGHLRIDVNINNNGDHAFFQKRHNSCGKINSWNNKFIIFF